ncbi:hypothetical protein NYO67_2122 [Aspergillus flavus]|nr:hypothetical protein NYO67_2122 [Aspergillus flavus]
MEIILYYKLKYRRNTVTIISYIFCSKDKRARLSAFHREVIDIGK